jgi:hypothetical protein
MRFIPFRNGNLLPLQTFYIWWNFFVTIILILLLSLSSLILLSLIAGIFFVVLFLNQGRPPPLRLQVLHSNTFLTMCSVPIMNVFCTESIKCFPGIASRFYFTLFHTISVTQIITGIIVQLRFYICYFSIPKLMYFNFFSLSFARYFCLPVLPHQSILHILFFLIIISGLYAVTSLSVCNAWFQSTVTYPSLYPSLGMCVYITFVCRFDAKVFAYWIMQMCTNFNLSD